MRRIMIAMAIVLCSALSANAAIHYEYDNGNFFCYQTSEDGQTWAVATNAIYGPIMVVDGYGGDMDDAAIMQWRQTFTKIYKAMTGKAPLLHYLPRYWKVHAPVQ